MDDLSGQEIRGYKLIERIGEGGFGVVYRAEQPSVDREVAIKVILPEFADHPDFVRRFEAEARMVAKLEHPHIVPLYDYWRDEGGAFLVMRWLRGGSLGDALKSGPWEIEAVGHVLEHIADALSIAHEHGVIHRDLKPENILLDEAGNAYLTDFGIAKDLGGEGLTQIGKIVGSVDYLSPEQAKGEEVTPQSDIYGLGVLLYEMLTGEHPFPGLTTVQMIQKHLNQSLPSLRRSHPELTAELNSVIQQATAKNPHERYSSVTEMLEAYRYALTIEEAGYEPPLPAFLEEVEGEQEIVRPVFVGREHELTQLEGFLDLSLANQGRVVFVTGDSGSGKTALIQEFTRRAQEAHDDLVVASGNCNSHIGVGDPYLPFREVLELLTGDVEARWAAGAITREHARRLWKTLPLAAGALLESGQDLIDTFIPGSALINRATACAPGGADWLIRLKEVVERKGSNPIISGPQQSDLFEQYTRVLRALSQKAALVLVLDDLQWADAGSIGLLFHLGRQLTGSQILIVGAYRQEEIALGREGTRHPLEPVVNEFQREFGAISVNLEQTEDREFVNAILDSEPNRLGPPFREMLHRQTRGHPLFTIELLRGMQERGDLVQDQENFWVEGSKLDWDAMPARVEAVFAERIGRLSQPMQTALRVASVEGEVFTAEAAARVMDTDERELLGHLSGELDRRHRLIRAESIQRSDGQLLSRYRFRHTLFQKYLYSSLDDVERVHLHEQLGNAIEGLYTTQEAIPVVALQLARHFEEAGIPEKTINYLRQAGERAVHLSAYREGISHLSRALELLHLLPDSPKRDQQELELQLSFGLAWKYEGPTARAKKAINRARDLCQQLGETAQLSRMLGELSIYHYVQAEYQQAHEFASDALSLAQQAKDPVLVAEGHWYLGFLKFCLGDYTNVRSHLEQVISFYNPEQHHRSLVLLRGVDAGLSAMAYHACCLWCLGYPDQALMRSQEVLALARGFDHPFTMVDVLCYAGCMFNLMRRDPVALKENAEAMIQLANEKELPGWMGMGKSFHGEAFLMLGQVQDAIAPIREGTAIIESSNVKLYKPSTLRTLAKMRAQTGDLESGLALLDEALNVVEQTDERHWEAELYRFRGELLLMQDDDAAAETSFYHAIEVSRRQKAKSWELRASIRLASLWQKQGKADEARGLLEPIYSWFTEGFDTPDLKEAKSLLEELS
jgi:predicted ATPase/predicted Ser/Thr protein kinase